MKKKPNHELAGEKDATINLFTWRKFELPKTVYKKMGKHHYGLFLPHTDEIEIDERLKGKRELEIHIHEMLHWASSFLTEDVVRMISRKLTDYLWREGYRKQE
jgi:hypothetical protein